MRACLDLPEFRGAIEVKDKHVDAFARALVRMVRDAAIQSCDISTRPDSGSPVALRWRQSNGDVRVVIADVVDETLFCLLRAIDSGDLPLKFTTEDGSDTPLAEAGKGELAGWYMGSGGWRELYSDERFVDDFADLADKDRGDDPGVH
jgi:hypothetical protein